MLATTSKTDGSQPIDMKTLADYITHTVATLVAELNESLISESLKDEVLEEFAKNPQSPMLVVSQINANDGSGDKSKVRYIVSNEIQHQDGQALSVVFAKKKPSPIMDSVLPQQLFVTLFDANDPDNSIRMYVRKVFVPRFKSANHDELQGEHEGDQLLQKIDKRFDENKVELEKIDKKVDETAVEFRKLMKSFDELKTSLPSKKQERIRFWFQVWLSLSMSAVGGCMGGFLSGSIMIGIVCGAVSMVAGFVSCDYIMKVKF